MRPRNEIAIASELVRPFVPASRAVGRTIWTPPLPQNPPSEGLALYTTVRLWVEKWQKVPDLKAIWADALSLYPTPTLPQLVERFNRSVGHDPLAIRPLAVGRVRDALAGGYHVLKVAYASRHYQEYEASAEDEVEVFGPNDIGRRPTDTIVVERVLAVESDGSIRVENPWLGFGGTWSAGRRYPHTSIQHSSCLTECCQLSCILFCSELESDSSLPNKKESRHRVKPLLV
jgi:hypothetical protein